jgi:hypothetical protein
MLDSFAVLQSVRFFALILSSHLVPSNFASTAAGSANDELLGVGAKLDYCSKCIQVRRTIFGYPNRRRGFIRVALLEALRADDRESIKKSPNIDIHQSCHVSRKAI